MYRTLCRKLPFNRTQLTSKALLVLGALFLLGITSLLCITKTPIQIPPPSKTVAIVQVIEHPALNATRQGIIDTLKRTNPSVKVIWESAQGSPALANQICQGFVGQSTDVIVAIGTTAAQSAVSVTTKSNNSEQTPVVFTSVTDPQSANLADKTCGVSNYIDVDKQITMIRQVLPNLRTLGMVYNPGEPFTEKVLQLTQSVCDDKGITLITSPAYKTGDVGTSTLAIVDKVDAIFINNDNTALAAFPVVMKICNEEKVPAFASDIDVIEQGALAVLGPDQYKIGEQTAQLVEKCLTDTFFVDNSVKNGINISYPECVELHINLKQATKLGVAIDQQILDRPDIKIYK